MVVCEQKLKLSSNNPIPIHKPTDIKVKEKMSFFKIYNVKKGSI